MQYLRQLQDESEKLIEQLIYLTYFMRGSVNYDDSFKLTFVERQLMNNFLNKRFEQESKHPHPQY